MTPETARDIARQLKRMLREMEACVDIIRPVANSEERQLFFTIFGDISGMVYDELFTYLVKQDSSLSPSLFPKNAPPPDI